MARKSILPQLSDIQKNILVNITKCRASPQLLVLRTRIVLLAAEGQNDQQIAPHINVHSQTARNWRLRWNTHHEKLQAIEADGDEKALKEYIINVVLADDPYNGKRGKYTAEQITQLYAIACEKPEDSGRPISHWSCRELGEEMVKRGIVERMPPSTVWDFLKSRGLETSQGRRLAQSQARRS